MLVEEDQECQLILSLVRESFNLEKSVSLIGRVFLRNPLNRHSFLELAVHVPVSSCVLQKCYQDSLSSFINGFRLIYHSNLHRQAVLEV